MPVLTHQLVAKISLVGMGLDLLGGCYLAYDLLGGKQGPLSTVTRAAGYVALFLIGYAVVLGLSFAVVASAGMGILLAIEYRIAGKDPERSRANRSRTLLFGFLRGLVLGVASMTVAGPVFGVVFGILAGVGLAITYAIGFAPTDDYESGRSPSTSGHKIAASLLRAVAVSAAGVSAALLNHSELVFGLRVGLAAGTVSALVGAFSPAIEWWIQHLPERRLGLIGLGMIAAGVVLQSAQYWVAAFDLPVR